MRHKKQASPIVHLALAAWLVAGGLLLMSPRDAYGYTTSTGTITITNGTNSDTTAASWDTYGTLTYTASPIPPGSVIQYDWSSSNSASQTFTARSDYVDARIYHRRVIIYDVTTVVWESCPQNALDSTTITNIHADKIVQNSPSPTSYQGASANDVVYKIQSSGTNSNLSASQFTLAKS